METFAAVLTAVLFWAFLAYLFIGNRQAAGRTAGRLLAKTADMSRGSRLGKRVLGFFAVFGLILWILMYFSGLYYGYSMSLAMLCLGLFVIPQVVWTVIMWDYNSRTEFRRHGLVSTKIGGPFTFIPWSHIRYCKWLFTGNTLLIQFKDHNVQLNVDSRQTNKITNVLVEHAEIRDSGGEPINADRLPFEYPNEPDPLEIRKLQFNLRTALLFMVLASAVFAWLGIHLRAGWREQEALTKLEESGVKVDYDNGWVRSLDFSNGSGSLTDGDLRHLKAFKHLHSLVLSETPITDAGLAHIKHLSTLKYLMLFNTPITDNGLKHVGKLTRLKNLGLDGAQVTNAGLVHLEPLTQLERLGLNETKVSGDGLVHLEGLSNLRIVSSVGSKVTEKGVQRLKKKLPKISD